MLMLKNSFIYSIILEKAAYAISSYMLYRLIYVAKCKGQELTERSADQPAVQQQIPVKLRTVCCTNEACEGFREIPHSNLACKLNLAKSANRGLVLSPNKDAAASPS